jgi:phospho-N-acetylmuramoyl-pentapeptide-transferase
LKVKVEIKGFCYHILMDAFIPVRPDIPLLAILAYALVAFLLGIIATPWYVRFLHRFRLGKQLRTEAVDGGAAPVFTQYHQDKTGTPTMGGVLIWGAILLTILLSRALSYFGFVERSLLQRGQVYLPLFMLLSFGLLGALDDYLNIRCIGRKRGLDWLPKISTLLLLSTLGALWFYFKLEYDSITIPYVGRVMLGGWYIPLFIFIIVGTANAVNVTDGLDGLAGGLLVIAFGAFGILAYLKGLTVLAAFCTVSVGAIAAFLWHNVPPALFFMGDTGALALGAALGVIALMIDQVLVLPLVGFVFVVEMLSVILQLLSKKLRHGKKIFIAAPLHHHLEALQWGESKVTMRLWIIGGFFAFLGIIIGFFN